MIVGQQTLKYEKPVAIISYGSIVGPKEAEGTIGAFFDEVSKNDSLEQRSYERAESLMHFRAIQIACQKLGFYPAELQAMVGGDLINQIVSTTLVARKIDAAFFGVYGACSSFGEALIIGSMLVDGYGLDKVSCSTSSHFSTAERQYRFPLELGTQPTPTSHRTVTGSGCAVLGQSEKSVSQRITYGTMGKVADFGIKNVNNMGGVMAGAAVATLKAHLEDTGRTSDYYDLILTGDLGIFGKDVFKHFCQKEGIILKENYNDSGAMFWNENPKYVMGGSGAGCISSVFCSYVMAKMQQGIYNKVLILPTGALLSKDSPLQGETIPSVCYAVAIENI